MVMTRRTFFLAAGSTDVIVDGECAEESRTDEWSATRSRIEHGKRANGAVEEIAETETELRRKKTRNVVEVVERDRQMALLS